MAYFFMYFFVSGSVLGGSDVVTLVMLVDSFWIIFQYHPYFKVQKTKFQFPNDNVNYAKWHIC